MQTAGASIGDADPHAAFTAQLELHAGVVRKVAATYASNRADRRDLAQEIALQLWRAWPRYDPARSFSTWMYRSALNVGISYLRRAGSAHRQALALEDIGLDPAAQRGDDSELEEQVALLRRLIEGLGPLDRGLLLLWLEQRSYREIAEVLGIGESNVATRLSRLRARLRGEMGQ